MKNIVVLISGRGSNLEALLQEAQRDNWRSTLDAAVVAVISNRADAPGLAVAERAGIATAFVDHRVHAGRLEFEQALIAAIDPHDPALVVLAGFMRVLTPAFVRHYAGRLINIHPSLLPLFPGLHTHRQALNAGVRVHGATVHFVSEGIDSGSIIAQAVVAVTPEDDEAALAARVLTQEHRLLPRAVRLVLERRIDCIDGRAITRGARADELLLLPA